MNNAGVRIAPSARVEKVAISLPSALLRQVEAERRARRESRSAFFRRAVELFFAARTRADRVAEYRAGYGRQPETPEELAAAEVAARQLLAEERWE